MAQQPRLRMDQFERHALLQYHQQAIMHALASQSSQKLMPAQLVFPDDTMAVGAPAVLRGALFPTDRDAQQETDEEQRQRRLLQNEPIVVYTSLSDRRTLAPDIAWRGIALLLVMALQGICIVLELADPNAGEPIGMLWTQQTSTTLEAVLYAVQGLLHVVALVAMYTWSPDGLMVTRCMCCCCACLLPVVIHTIACVFMALELNWETRVRACRIQRHRVDDMGTSNPYGYGFKLALAVIVLYFGVALMMKFEDILLPFIFALLLVSILEPVKNTAQACLEGTLLLIMQRVSVCSCFGTLKSVDLAKGTKRLELKQPVKRLFLICSILWTLVLAGRLFWVVGHIVWLSVQTIINDLDFYVEGAQRRQEQAQALLKHFGLQNRMKLDMEHLTEMLMNLLRLLLEEVSAHGIFFISQLVLTAIFSLFLLYSPPQRDFSPAMGGVFRSMETYLKLKTLISAIMGVTNGTALAFIGLELPAAWGLLTFLANFIPYIGAPCVSLAPCFIALMDVRKHIAQVVAAFLAQFALHFTIANFIEPIVFGISEEIHSVVVLLGLSFFGYVWGISGMFLGVPLLYATHAWLTVVARSSDFSTEARDDSRFLMAMLEGRWLADAEAHSHGPRSARSELSDDISNSGPPSPHGDRHEAKSSLKGKCSQAWILRDPDSGDVKMMGLLLRWAVMTVIGLLLFLGFGVEGIISSATSAVAQASGGNFSSTVMPEDLSE